MRNLFTFLVVSTILFSSCQGSDEVEIGNKTTMIVDPVYDAGTVVKGEVITAKIRIKNAGSYPLVIADVSPGCSCTVSEKPQDPIAPGEEITFLAHVDTDKISGSIVNKGINIVANTEPSVTTVVIRGKIKKK
jgi:hypothetical protein